MQNVNVNLIGARPAMEVYRDSLPAVIARYRASAPIAAADRDFLATLSGNVSALAVFMDERMKDPVVRQRVADGLIIELCAMHFYGIEPGEMNSINDTIAAIEAMDAELEFGK